MCIRDRGKTVEAVKGVKEPLKQGQQEATPAQKKNYRSSKKSNSKGCLLYTSGYVFLVDEIQQVVVYLAGSNRFNLTPLEMLLEIAEIGGIYAYGMVTVCLLFASSIHY